MEQPRSLLEYALDAIRENILIGKYPAGQKLSTQDIAEELGISRTPVNAAINRLVAEGLAEAIPRRGTIVRKLSKKQIQEIIDVRTILEVYAAQEAIKNVDEYPEKLQHMKELICKFDEFVEYDYKFASTIESDFHRTLIELSGNEQLLRLYDTNWTVGSAFYLYAMRNMPFTKQKTLLEEHKYIVKLIEDKKSEELEKVLRGHIAFVKDVLETV